MFKDRSIPLTDKWLDNLKKDIEESYLKYPEPWKQAGFTLDEAAWIACRKPLAECIDKSGSFLDISCSNGYLLECLIKWTAEKGLSLTPYGIDLSAKLIEVAKTRLTKYAGNFFVGSATKWTSPVKFDFIRTELGYVLDESQEKFLYTLTNNFLAADGKLIITEYRSLKQNVKEPWSTDKIVNWDFDLVTQKSAIYERREMLRALVLVRKPMTPRQSQG